MPTLLPSLGESFLFSQNIVRILFRREGIATATGDLLVMLADAESAITFGCNPLTMRQHCYVLEEAEIADDVLSRMQETGKEAEIA